MMKLKPWSRNNLLSWALAVLLPGFAFAGSSQGGQFLLIKDAWGVSVGPGLQAPNVTLTLCAGEQLAGFDLLDSTAVLRSGYLSGFFGAGQTLHLLSFKVGDSAYFQDGLQIGVSPGTTVQIALSDQIQESTLPLGIIATLRLDHMGQEQNSQVSLHYQYDPVGQTVSLTPSTTWQGNSFYDIVLTPNLQSIDAFPLDTPSHIQFLTALDPQEDNVVLNPITAALRTGTLAAGPSPGGVMQINIPQQAMTDFSMVRVSQDPLHSPLQIDPQIIRTANQKALLLQGVYGAPLALGEVHAYDLQGKQIGSLSRPAVLSLSYPASGSASGGIVRPDTLSLWALDEAHSLWVKMPGSIPQVGAFNVTGAISRFSVFALMGGAAGTTKEAIVFPNPWRPHGPTAGNGPGQTGTDAGGLTFSNLPPECKIKIYTLSGELVRELHHSDASGPVAQEPWDGLTAHGQHAASGVYLWRVESPVDGTNGKLMIIR